MKVSNLLQAPASLSLDNGTQLFLPDEAGWTPQMVWELQTAEESTTPAMGLNLDFSAMQTEACRYTERTIWASATTNKVS
jgi:hypothetical protein